MGKGKGSEALKTDIATKDRNIYLRPRRKTRVGAEEGFGDISKVWLVMEWSPRMEE